MTGAVVVITGGAGDLGRALARRFAARGARVVLLDRDTAALREARAALEGSGISVRTERCDVTAAGDCEATLTRVAAAEGGVDVLVNNAGVGQRSAFVDTRPEVFERVLAVNVLGSVHATRAALPHLLARRGRILVISSVAGLAPLLGRSAYAASKHALQGLFHTLRAELAPQGVSVTLVAPSFFESGFEQRSLGGDGAPVRRPRSRVGRVMSVDAVAEAAVTAAWRRRRQVVLSPVGRLTQALWAVAPGLYERWMARLLASELAPPPVTSPD